jgi:hypothetical protein
MPRQYPDRPQQSEEVYADWEDELETWGVFGLDSGHCYSTPGSKELAEQSANEMNAARKSAPPA